MAIPMDTGSDQASREHVQRLFNKNLELENKRKKATQARIPLDPNTWQLMRENYEAIILEDHAFSGKREVEYALWQLHYRRIEELRSLFNAAVASAGSAAASQNAKGPPRGGPDRIAKIRAQFKAFLSEATGFYHDLMVKIRVKYGLSLGYFLDDPDSQLSLSKGGVKLTELRKGLVSCHRCLIYLGDLARYKGLNGEGESKARDFTAASSYYTQASSLMPSSGNPHHQLAIIATYSCDELVAIYRYFRSLAVDSPFVTARDNLIVAFAKNRQSYSQLLGEVKTSAAMASSTCTAKGRGKIETRMPPKDNLGNVNSIKERASEAFKAFGTRFVRLNGILFTRTSLETFGEVLSVVRNELVELLGVGPDEVTNFGSDAAECRLVIVRLVAILIFTVHNVHRETENQTYAEILQRSALLQNAFAATFDIVGLLLERCMQLTDPSVSYLLPGIMVFVEWLACHQDIAVGSELDEKQASVRLYFWNQCIPFLNKLLSCGSAFLEKDEDETCFFNMTTYKEGETTNRIALCEDFELRGFVPFAPAQLILDFSQKQPFSIDGGNKEKKVRIQRIIAAGKALANVVRLGEAGVYFDLKSNKFIIGSEPPTSDDYSLTNSLEVPKLSNNEQGNPAFSDLEIGSMQPKAQYVESEEEDEVIVFKPSTTEKPVDVLALNMTLSDGHACGVDAVKLASRKENRLFSAGPDALYQQSSFNTNLKPPSSPAQNNVHYLQPIHSGTTKWLVAEQAPTFNSLSNTNLMEQGLNVKSESENSLGVKPLDDFSAPLPLPVISDGGNYSVYIPETGVPFKELDSVMSSAADAKHSSNTSAGSKMNLVSRPRRHIGPPPGFRSVPPKLDDATAVKKENSSAHPMDDYRWLDAYQFPTSKLSNGIDKSVHSSVHSYSKGNSSIGMLNFPFTGKQMSQAQMENPNGWPGHQLSVHTKLQKEQLQQLQRQTQQSVAMPQQYQGQSLWEGHSLV